MQSLYRVNIVMSKADLIGSPAPTLVYLDIGKKPDLNEFSE